MNFHNETPCLIKAFNAACRQLLSRLSEHLTALSVFYRSQMGRGARIKCIKCPPIELYERIKGFAKLCHKAVNHCHTRLQFTTLTAGEKKPWGCCHKEYKVVCQVIHLNINTLSNGNLKKEGEIGTTTQDTTNYHSISIPEVYLQECCCNSIPLHLRSTHHHVFHLSPVSCVAVASQPAMQKS